MLLCIIGWMLNTMHFKPIANLLTIFLFNNFGICWVVSDNPVLWFTSALFAGLLVYFCLIKFVPQKYNKWIITVLFIIGYLILEYLQHGSFSKPIKIITTYLMLDFESSWWLGDWLFNWSIF